MSKTEFLHINLSTGDDNHMPQVSLFAVYSVNQDSELRLVENCF